MANLKNITELPLAESAEGLNLIVNDNGAAKQIAASAVGAQADFAVTDEKHPAFIKNKPASVNHDWNQNDHTAPDYVKNRTHYTEEADIVVLEPTEVYYEDFIPISLVLGKEYTVTFDNEDYVVTCKEYATDTLYIGNEHIGSQQRPDTGEPFVLISGNNDSKCMVSIGDVNAHTMSITIKGEVVHTLDPKYLPEPDMVIEIDAVACWDGATTDNVRITKGSWDEVISLLTYPTRAVNAVVKIVSGDNWISQADEIKAQVSRYGERVFIKVLVHHMWNEFIGAITISIDPDNVIVDVICKQIALSE